MAGIQIDGANQKLYLDSDADTYFEAATDDTIKVYVAGAHDLTISANAINVLSGTTLTIDSGATITNSGTSSGFGAITALNNATANELVSVGSTTTELDAEANLTFDGTDVLVGGAGKVQLRDTGLYVASNADGDLDIVSDGTAVDSINLESAGGVTLDAGTASSGVIYEDDGTEMLRIHNSSSDVIVESKVSDKDIIIKGNDGGSTATALTFDMSDKGAMILGAHGNINFPDSQNASSDVNTLDDYEEGSWTVALTLEAGTATVNSSYNTGAYTKIGRMVHMHCYIYVSAVSSNDGWFNVSLPFTCDNNSAGQVSGYSAMNCSLYGSGSASNSISAFVGYTSPNEAKFTMLGWQNTTEEEIADELNTSSRILVSGTYMATA
jgi:hypothetical protein